MDETTFYKHMQAAQAATIIAVDTETSGLRVREGEDYLMGISIAYTVGGVVMSAYFPFRHEKDNLDKSFIQPLRELLEDSRIVFHNAPFDIASLRTIGIRVRGDIWDTQVMAHHYNENLPSKELDWLSKYFLKDEKKHDPLFEKWIKLWGWKSLPVELMAPYAEKDAELTLRLFKLLYAGLNKQEILPLWKHEIPFIKAIHEMEKNGIRVNLDECDKYARIAKEEMERIEAELGFAPSKPAELADLFFETLGMPILERTKGGKPSLNKNVMVQYDELLSASENETAKLVLAYRGWQKADATAYSGYPKLVAPDGRVHPSFKIFGTKTGRLSCEKPNLQQIPRRSDKPWNGQIKNLFIPEEGYELWEFDYGQLEFRLASLYSGDESLISAWQNSEDPYQQVADAVGITRQQAKTLVLSILYGAGDEKVAYMLRITEGEAHAIRQNFQRQYPGLRRKMRIATDSAMEKRFVKYWTGRRRHFTKFNPEEEHKAFNSVLQGGGFEIVKRAIVELLPLSTPEHRMVLTIHDSIVWEIEQSKVAEFVPQVVEVMEHASKFTIPFIVEPKVWGAS